MTVQRRSQQRGATLVVALVILAVITLLGITSIRSSSLELKMAASARDRSIAFQAAESALLTVERHMIAQPPRRIALLPSCSTPVGSGDIQDQCFTDTCTNGRCFTGRFVGTTQNSDCRLTNATDQMVQPWKNTGIWNSPESHAVIQVARTDAAPEIMEVKYLLEFMCFVLPDDIALENNTDPYSDAVPLYRITVMAAGEAGRANVMLQSTISVPEA